MSLQGLRQIQDKIWRNVKAEKKRTKGENLVTHLAQRHSGH